MSNQLSQKALDDLASSGLAPHIIGQPYSKILQDIVPFDVEYFEQFFPDSSAIWKHEKINGVKTKTFRPCDGYGWNYGGELRVKNLDPDFHVIKNGVPEIDKNGKIKIHRYLSPPKSKPHLYLTAQDLDAAASETVAYFMIEGEKKKRFLSALLELLPKFRQSHLSKDHRWCVVGLQGVFSTETPELNELTGGTKDGQTEDIPFHNMDFSPMKLNGKPIFFAFDADSSLNPMIIQAELRLLGILVMRGAALKMMRSLEWDFERGKGLDDYLMTSYRAALGDAPMFDENLQPLNTAHPCLDALNQVVRLARHPFLRWSKMPLNFVIRAVTSGVKTGLTMNDLMREELAVSLKENGYKKISKSLILKTINSAIRDHLSDKRYSDDVLTELRLAEEFAKENCDKLVYHSTDERWLCYDGHVWSAKDGKAVAIQKAKDMLRRAEEIFGGDDEQLARVVKDQARRMESQTVLERVVAHAATIKEMRREASDFDRAPNLINLQNCVFDLDARAWLHKTPEQYHTKMAHVEYQADATCPKWTAFLNLIFENTPHIDDAAMEDLTAAFPHIVNLSTLSAAKDQTLTEDAFARLLSTIKATPAERREIDARCRRHFEKIKFLQQMLGLSLSGYSNEKIFIYAHGVNGNNGKSTIYNLFERLLGGYFARIPAVSLLVRGAYKTDLNDGIGALVGARMAVSDEFSEGTFDMSQLKALTGAETVVFRRPHKETLQFSPSHTLWGMGNPYPRINAPMSDPIWERIAILEFPVSLVELAKHGKFAKRDMSVVIDEFMTEASGILRWALEGYFWYKDAGALIIPDSIKADCRHYRRTQDHVMYFVEEMCDVVPADAPKKKIEPKERRSELWRVYSQWCRDNGTPRKPREDFWKELLTLPGVEAKEGGGGVVYFYHIKLRTA